MKSLGIHNYEDSWLLTTRKALRTHITAPNLIGILGAILALALLLGLHDPWNIRLPLYLIVTVWVLLRPRVALYLIPISVPWGAIDYITLGALRFNSTDVLVGLIIVAWLLSFVLLPSAHRVSDADLQDTTPHAVPGPCDRVPQPVPVYLILAMLTLLFTMLISMTVAISLSDSLKEIIKWLEFLVVVLLGAQYIRTRRHIWTIVVFVCLAGISQGILGYLQRFLNLGPQAFIRDNSLRVYGTFDQPNPYAGYINMVLSVALAVALLGRNWLTRLLAGITVLILVFPEYFTESKGGWIAIGTAAIFILVVGVPQIRAFAKVLIIGLLAIVAAFLGGLLPMSVFNPVLNFVGLTGISLSQPTTQQYATAERIAHWLAGLHMFFDHPWLGVGIGNYPDAYPKYMISIFVLPLGHAHNYFINVAAEMGVVGLVVYTLFLLATFVVGVQTYRALTRKYREIKAQRITKPDIPAPVGTRAKLLLLLQPSRLVQYYQRPGTFEDAGILTNDRALAIGISAALITVLMHNMVDDLYVQGMTCLMALLLAILIRLKGVTLNSISDGGQLGNKGDATRER